MAVRNGVTTRGVKNDGERGSAEDRRRRKNWLLETWAADCALIRVEWESGYVTVDHWVISPEILMTYPDIVSAETVPTCRCYRCGTLLWFETLTVDRRVPGVLGGTYRRDNIRPACGPCNSETGGPLANSKAHKPAKVAARRRGVRVKA